MHAKARNCNLCFYLFASAVLRAYYCSYIFVSQRIFEMAIHFRWKWDFNLHVKYVICKSKLCPLFLTKGSKFACSSKS